jgi:hypothetical protein
MSTIPKASQLDMRTNLLVILLGGDKLCLGLDRLDSSSSTVLAFDKVVSDTNGRNTSKTEVKCGVAPRLGLGRLSSWRGRGRRVLAGKGGTGESLASSCATKRRSGAEGGAEGVEGHVVVEVGCGCGTTYESATRARPVYWRSITERNWLLSNLSNQSLRIDKRNIQP